MLRLHQAVGLLRLPTCVKEVRGAQGLLHDRIEGVYLSTSCANYQHSTLGREAAPTAACDALPVQDVYEPEMKRIVPYMFCIGLIGIFTLVILRKRFVIDYRLPFPSGTATGALISSFHTPKGEAAAQAQVRSHMFRVFWGFRVSFVVRVSGWRGFFFVKEVRLWVLVCA